MLEFILVARDSANYNIINWALNGDIARVLPACGAHFKAGDWTFLPYWVALDVGVNPINGNLLLRGPQVPSLGDASLLQLSRIEPPPGSGSAYLPGVNGTGEGEHPTHLRSL